MSIDISYDTKLTDKGWRGVLIGRRAGNGWSFPLLHECPHDHRTRWAALQCAKKLKPRWLRKDTSEARQEANDG